MNPLLIEKGRPTSFDEFGSAVEAIASGLRGRLSGQRKLAFVVESENAVSAYAKVRALLCEGHVVLPCPPYQFGDSGYREFLKKETGTDFVFVARDQSPADAAATAPASALFHPLIASALARGAQPLILRTSGTSGKKFKFVLHDYRLITAKHERITPYFERNLAFFPFESIAGIETLTEAICQRRSLVVAGDQLVPAEVARLIRETSVDYILTTPSFLNLLLISRHVSREKLGGLKKLKYGSEPANKTALVAIQRALPDLELMHVYGMTEIGILRSQTSPTDPSMLRLSESENAWRFYGEGSRLLEVKSPMTSLGYLNAELPVHDGWFRTNDSVEEENGYLRILGRADETINVAGRKFFPSELEELLLRMDGVADTAVLAEKNDLIGQSIVAKIFLRQPEDEVAFRVRFKAFCEERVPSYMFPHRVVLLQSPPVGPRGKKTRHGV